MTALRAHIHISEDGTLTGHVPAGTEPGEHDVTITLRRNVIARRKRKVFMLEGFPLHTGPWDNTMSLRREDLYGDDGR